MATKEDKKGIELDKDKRLEVIFHELDFGLHGILIFLSKEENIWRRKINFGGGEGKGGK